MCSRRTWAPPSTGRPLHRGAVVSIAYDVPAPLVDGNVERVFARLFGMEGIQLGRSVEPAGRRRITSSSGWGGRGSHAGTRRSWARRAGLHAAGPRCEECPWRTPASRAPRGTRRGSRAPTRRATTEVELEIYVIERGGRWLLERPDGGLMESMCVPHRGGHLVRALPRRAGPRTSAAVEPEHDLIALSHGITHHRIRARVRAAASRPRTTGPRRGSRLPRRRTWP